VAEEGRRADEAGSRETDVATQLEEASRNLELADPDAHELPLDRWINRVVEAVGIALLAAILLIVFSNATSRYLFNYSFVWAEEAVMLLIPWLAIIGLFLSARRRQMIHVEFFVARMGTRARALVRAFGELLCVVAFGHLAFVAYNYVSVFGRDSMPYMGVPKGIGSSALVIGSGLVAMAFVIGLVRRGLSARGAGR